MKWKSRGRNRQAGPSVAEEPVVMAGGSVCKESSEHDKSRVLVALKADGKLKSSLETSAFTCPICNLAHKSRVNLGSSLLPVASFLTL